MPPRSTAPSDSMFWFGIGVCAFAIFALAVLVGEGAMRMMERMGVL
jgi:hypothetical protein